MKCPTTLQTIRHIFKQWEKTTGETLDPMHVPTVLFGDRTTDQTYKPPGLEEPYRVIQATLMQTLWTARNQRVHPKSPNGKRITYSQRGLLTDIKRRVQEQVSHIYTRARETHQVPAFDAAWIRTGIARMQHGKPHFQLLDPGARRPLKGKHENHWYVDGSFFKEKVAPKVYMEYAGSGIAHYTGPEENLQRKPRQTIHLPVVTDPNHPLYCGATRKTNNTGEITALLHAIWRATLSPKGHYHQMHCDSTYAINRAATTASPKKNRAIVANLRKALRDCRAKHGYRNVQIVHVKAHNNHVRNDKADELAKRGAKATGLHCEPG